jgi:hypothetical protein
MDVLPYGSKEIFSFIYPRKVKNNPVDDFRRMADMLGNAWWAERRRTNKKYLASRRVFEQAHRNNFMKNPVKPLEMKIPSIKSKSLIHLKLGKSELESPELQRLIKKAYRTQAKKHHPDRGGNSAAFRKIQQAYVAGFPINGFTMDTITAGYNLHHTGISRSYLKNADHVQGQGAILSLPVCPARRN